MDLGEAIKKAMEAEKKAAKLEAKTEALETKLEEAKKAKLEITERANKYKENADKFDVLEAENIKKVEEAISKKFGDKASEAKEYLKKGLKVEEVSKLLDIEEEEETVIGGGNNPSNKKQTHTIKKPNMDVRP